MNLKIAFLIAFLDADSRSFKVLTLFNVIFLENEANCVDWNISGSKCIDVKKKIKDP